MFSNLSTAENRRMCHTRKAVNISKQLGSWLSDDCIDYVTGIGNAHAHNGVHSVLRLG